MRCIEIENYIEYITSIILRKKYNENDVEKLNKIKDMFYLMKYLFILKKYKASLSLLKEITDISDTLDCLILRKEIYSSTNNLFFMIKERC